MNYNYKGLSKKSTKHGRRTILNRSRGVQSSAQIHARPHTGTDLPLALIWAKTRFVVEPNSILLVNCSSLSVSHWLFVQNWHDTHRSEALSLSIHKWCTRKILPDQVICFPISTLIASWSRKKKETWLKMNITNKGFHDTRYSKKKSMCLILTFIPFSVPRDRADWYQRRNRHLQWQHWWICQAVENQGHLLAVLKLGQVMN